MIFIENKPVNHYWAIGDVTNITPYGNGHINDTYLITADFGQFILQRINKDVFLTEALIDNYEVHVKEVIKYQFEKKRKITPLILQTKNKKYHLLDNENYAWRLVEYIPSAISYDISPSPDVSFRASKAVASYQLFLNTLDLSSVTDTISNFHNLAGRFKTLKEVIKKTSSHFLLKAKAELKYIISLSPLVEQSSKLIPQLPTRVIHNDTKLNNVIFQGEQGLVIDLDTVMPGKIMFDFGDMIRSYTSPVAEDDPEIEKTIMRTDHFIAITKAYLGVLNNEMSSIEKSSLLTGAKYIIYEQCIRFLTDYLQGNKYYKTNYPDHNLIRAKTQLKLLQSLIDQETELKSMMAQFM